MKSIHDVLAELRDSAFDERHKGDLFEALTKKYLEIDPFYSTYFDKVWMYGEWALEAGISKQDTGIDLVARIAETGEIAAVQCKFYAENARLDKPEIDSFLSASGREPFKESYIFSTTDNWTKHASDAIVGRYVPTYVVRVQDLDESGIDWSDFSLQDPTKLGLLKKKTPFPHQLEAIEAAKAHFQNHDRGKMIMACGTGKTYTSLQIVQEMTPKRGTVLFLVPSLALLSQTLKEWKREAAFDFRAYAVCSDTKLSRQSSNEDTRVADLAYPSTTNVEKLASHFNQGTEAALTVIFSTYQSIDVVAQAQTKGLPEFDLIVCDEAHRTTGVTLVDEDESAFVRVHDNNFIKGSKRLYMTATPRIFAEASKAKAEEASAVIASMDDETKFGQEFHRLNFGNAVSRGLLSDYKVLVLTVSETQVSKSLQKILTDGDELKLQDAIKIVGCYNGLRKRGANEDDFLVDKTPMRTAVAFSRSIKDSKRIAELFSTVTTALNEEAKEKNALKAEADHVDGTFNVLARNEKLDWLKDKKTENTVRVLSNARCLSEGVDVPALDAVLFLNPRDSQVDVVQSVGRVMRKAEGKQYGYVILPIAVPAGKSAEEALADNKNYKVVWQVLQALRAHDERFDALVNKIDLTGDTGNVIEVIDASPGRVGNDWDGNSSPKEKPTDLVPLFDFDFADWKDAILAKIVQKVGQRTYWENWAKDVAEIATTHIGRINAHLNAGNQKLDAEFEHFLKGLQDNLNPSVTRENAIEMLAQHLITRPVFDALFESYAFSDTNPVSQAMNRMISALDEVSFNLDDESLTGFYESVRLRASGIEDSGAKQKIVKELYEKFFKLAFPQESSRLGIVYTPNEIVDFLIRSADDVLREHFASSIGDLGVHVLDPFTGTGTFIVRLLQSGLISESDFERKFRYELHANEIVLLAYYVAAINIEATFHELKKGDYVPFDGIVLTDTFQTSEDDDRDELFGLEVFKENNHRVVAQKKEPIRVIVGNPPYSVGQTTANENNQNLKYATLDRRIFETYVAETDSQSVNKLYDSYIRAIRWASDRIGDKGVVSFVVNGGFLDGSTTAGLRKTLVKEYSDIYIYDLRGNSRESHEQGKKEGGNVFDIRIGVAMMILVKRQDSQGDGNLWYHQSEDYLSKQEKLEALKTEVSMSSISWERIVPNSNGDWLNQRSEEFSKFIPIGSKDKASASEVKIFSNYSLGLATGRDAWVTAYSSDVVANNVSRMIDFYNSEVDRYKAAGSPVEVDSFINTDPTKISWNRNAKNDLSKGLKYRFDPKNIRKYSYRPFCEQFVYFEKDLNAMTYQLPKLFPSEDSRNLGICFLGDPHGVLMVDNIPDLNFFGFGGQVFPLFDYSLSSQETDDALFGVEDEPYAITDSSLALFKAKYGEGVSKEDIFYYVYGVLHSKTYTEKFAADLQKEIPRVPLATDFWTFSSAGRELADLHLGLSSIDPYPLEEVWSGTGKSFRVEKMRYGKASGGNAKSEIVVNQNLKLVGIPEKAFEYKLGVRTAIDWVVDRYQIKEDKDSGLIKDPNRSNDEKYIIDLLKRVVTLSLKTLEIQERLPTLEFN